jgi:hypothetical protein
MYLDHENLFCEDQEMSGSAYSTNYIDMGQANTGRGEPVDVLCQVTDDCSGVASASITAILRDCATSGGSYADLVTVGPVLVASLVAGYRFDGLRIPETHKRYLKLYFKVVEAFTLGEVTAGLVKNKQTNGYAFTAEVAP